MHFFWGGPFSNWFIAPITIRGFEFNCCEQYFMTAKAAMFGDSLIAELIVKETDPRQQKALGRKISNFNPTAWDAVSRDVMFRCNFAKYTQHQDLAEHLLRTGDKEIVEASPYDVLWGVGLAKDDPRILDKKQWRGKNWLGEILMEVRAGLRVELDINIKHSLETLPVTPYEAGDSCMFSDN